MRRLLPALLCLLALAAVVPAPAAAGGTQESQIQDDPIFVYGSAQEVDAALDAVKALGADRIRVTLQWRLVAPRPESRRKPRFEAADHRAYPADAWKRYDRVVYLARQKGIGVNFNISAPGPRWAMRPVRRRDIRHVYAPSPGEFAKFVFAAGMRYGPGGPAPEQLSVDYWSIWNEPNQGAWLAPQWARARGTRRTLVEWAPQRYRRLVDAAWDALQVSGHAGDTVLIGELAPTGRDERGRTRPIKPRRFLRALYCVDSRLRPLRGVSAERRNCPRTTRDRRRFVRRNPGLFRATGFAHHPYSLLTSPRRRTRDRDSVAMADLGRLRSDLKRIFRRWGVRRVPPLYLTEYGFQTNPPDKWAGISPGRQAAWLNEADYLAWRRPYVKSVAQFMLFDDGPDRSHSRNSAQYWRTFQSGLLGLDGRPKPAYHAYQVPIHVTRRVKPRSKPFRIWGQVRPPADDAGPLKVDVEWRSRSGSWRLWERVTSVTTANRRGYLQVLTKLPAGAGQVRLVHDDPASEKTYASRPVNVRAR